LLELALGSRELALFPSRICSTSMTGARFNTPWQASTVNWCWRLGAQPSMRCATLAGFSANWPGRYGP